MTTAGDVFARRAGRVAFGVVMLAGIPALVTHALTARRWDELPPGAWHAWQIIVATWLLATTVGLLVRFIVPHVRFRREADALRDAALWVPAVGVALLMPLTLHMFAFTDDPRGFEDWVRLSLGMVSHTHLCFAVLVYGRARALSAGDEPVSVPRIYLLTCVFAALPFVIPVVYVAITGIPIVPLLLWMKRVARLDREHVDVPFAIARVA